MVVATAIMAGVGIASSIFGAFQTAAANLAKGDAAIEESYYAFKEAERVSTEMGERNLINNEETARQASQVSGRQIAGGASQGKGVSSSSLMQLADTATKMSRVIDLANRDTNWKISNINRDASRKADQTMNELKANATNTKNAAINSAFQAVSQSSGVIDKFTSKGGIKTKTDVGQLSAATESKLTSEFKFDNLPGGTEDSILGSFGPKPSIFGEF